ncbi:MAG: rhomboid family intramembrane serine protease [Candidatus Thorarchaeota archaeon]
MAYAYGIRPMQPFMTYILILLNTVIFICQYIFGYSNVILLFGMIPAKILTGQNLYTLVTSIFLHGDFFHLLINMYFLYIFGSIVEREMHPFLYFLLFLLAGIVGSFGHILITYTIGSAFGSSGVNIPAIGASGAIFGIMAAYAYLLPRRPVGMYGDTGRTTAAWNIIFIYFFIEVISIFISLGSGIAHGAHVFGFVGGYLFAFLYRFIRIRRIRQKPGAEYDPYEYYV